MKRILLLTLAVFAAGAGCNSGSSSSSSATSTATTEIAGTWATTGTGTCTTGCTATPGTYTVKLVSSTCSVTTPLGVFTVQGTVCFIANNNSQAGSIYGTNIPTTAKNLGQGVLVGTTADPVPDNATVNLLFVSATGKSSYVEFTGTATVVGGKMTGSGACSSTTPACNGASASFTATKQ